MLASLERPQQQTEGNRAEIREKCFSKIYSTSFMQFSWYKDLFILTHVRRLGSKNTNRAVWKKQFAEQLQKNHTFAGLYFELKNIRKYFVNHCYSTKGNGANNWFLVILNCQLVVTVVFTLCPDWLVANDFTHHLSNRRSLLAE